jgi:hypothetical protein
VKGGAVMILRGKVWKVGDNSWILDNAILKLVTSSCGVGYYPRQWHVRAMYTSWSPATVTWNIIENSQYYLNSEIVLYPPCFFGQSAVDHP